MENERIYDAFAITAKCLNVPKKLCIPIIVANLDTKEGTIWAKKVNASWDTGSEICIMSKSLADDLGFKFNHKIESLGIGGSDIVPVGMAQIALVNNGDLVDVMAAVVDQEWPGYSFIIGMDFISKGSLAISCEKLTTTLSFTIPARKPVDYVDLLKEDSDVTTKHIPLGSNLPEDNRIYRGREAFELIFKK